MDKLPLQNILRQLLCGAVFFASMGVLLPDKAMGFVQSAHVGDSVTFWLGCAFVLSLAVGTLIYHIEKNFYSYAVQILMDKSCTKQTKSGERTCPSIGVRTAGLLVVGLTVIMLGICLQAKMNEQCANVIGYVLGICVLNCCVVFITKICDRYKENKWEMLYKARKKAHDLWKKAHDLWKKMYDGWKIIIILVIVAVVLFTCDEECKLIESAILTGITSIVLSVGFTFLLCMLRCRNIRDIAEHTRQLWLMEDLGGESDSIRGKANSVIMRRVANWSDFIHCGQCCALAWILGSFCVLFYCWRYDPGNVPYVRINLGLLCSLLLLALELIADWHRYHHVLYVLNNNAKGKSESDPTSNSQQ